MNIFVIDKATKKNLGIIDFIPNRQDRIMLKIVVDGTWTDGECIVESIFYYPENHGILVFISVVEPYYYNMIKDIEW